MKIAGMLILVFFYAVYLGKMLLQKRRGIRTDQIAKGRRRDRVFYVEWIMKIATYSVVIGEIGSIFLAEPLLPGGFALAGCALGVVGDLVFAVAVVTMRDSWRAGLAEDDETEMVTDGIYEYSRNPAFVGFDCVYIGLLLMFFNWVLAVLSLFAMLMLHIQILQEETYLEKVFGEKYLAYKRATRRYFGRKKGGVAA